MRDSAGPAVLNAVVVGTLLVGSSLPFDEGEVASLWGGPSVAGAAVARLAVIALVLVLVGVALGGATVAAGILQLT
ncbi:hypothetical protein, partial [Nocardioides caeni]